MAALGASSKLATELVSATQMALESDQNDAGLQAVMNESNSNAITPAHRTVASNTNQAIRGSVSVPCWIVVAGWSIRSSTSTVGHPLRCAEAGFVVGVELITSAVQGSPNISK